MSKKEDSGAITKNRAIKIFEALGFKTAEKWDTIRLQKKLEKLGTLIEGAQIDKKNQKRINEILRFQKKGHKVIVVDPDDAVADKKRGKAVEDAAKRETKRKSEKKAEMAKKEKASAKKDVKDKETAKKQEKRIAEKADIDKFGSRKGSNCAKINAVLSKKPKPMKQLVKEAKVSGTYYELLKSLVKEGHVKKSDKGYALA